jgi:hypothetical protein
VSMCVHACVSMRVNHLQVISRVSVPDNEINIWSKLTSAFVISDGAYTRMRTCTRQTVYYL